jgi:hypothetical protein
VPHEWPTHWHFLSCDGCSAGAGADSCP